jgi:hypothetical protein
MVKRERGSVSNMPQVVLARSILLCVATRLLPLQRCEKRGQRERGSESNTPPADLVKSILCSDAPIPSAEMKG